MVKSLSYQKIATINPITVWDRMDSVHIGDFMVSSFYQDEYYNDT
jgi:hypothetical protein